MKLRIAYASAAALLISSAVPALAQQAPAQRTAQQRAEQFAQLPYWPGYWVSEGQAGTTIGGIAPATLAAREGRAVPSVPLMSLAGAGAPWSEEGRRRQQEARAKSGGRKAQGWGFPMMMNAATPLQFLVTPEEVLIINSYNEARHIYTDGRSMPPEEDLWPTVAGTSIGRWEGDTLVVETIMVKNPNDYFHGAPSLSEQARYVERIRMDGDRLVSDVTITDPVTLTGAWNVTVSWVRDEGFDRMVQIDWDNDRTGSEDGINTIEAQAVE